MPYQAYGWPKVLAVSPPGAEAEEPDAVVGVHTVQGEDGLVGGGDAWLVVLTRHSVQIWSAGKVGSRRCARGCRDGAVVARGCRPLCTPTADGVGVGGSAALYSWGCASACVTTASSISYS